MNPLITVMSTKFYKGYPNDPLGEAPTFEKLSIALMRRYQTDAHFSAYCVPEIPRRLRTGVLGVVPVVMVLAVFDRDCEAVHGTSESVPESWWISERGKIFDLLHDHPDAFVYRSRAGYRIVYALEPITISNVAHHDAWKRLYVGWCAYLSRVYGIDADRSCKDFTRLYRLPFVRRDGRAEEREVLGNPEQIGIWNPRLLHSDLPEEKKKKSRSPQGAIDQACKGRLHDALNTRGWIGNEKEPGVWVIQCPFDHTHTTGEAFDGSTVLYGAKAGYDLGWIHCFHSHCESRTALEYLRALTPSESVAR